MFIPIASAQTGDGWDDPGTGWEGDILPTPTPTNSRSETALINTFDVIYVAVPLLGLVFLALIGVGVIKFDDGTIMIAVTVGVMVSIGIAIALYIMSTITTSGVV